MDSAPHQKLEGGLSPRVLMSLQSRVLTDNRKRDILNGLKCGSSSFSFYFTKEYNQVSITMIIAS